MNWNQLAGIGRVILTTGATALATRGVITAEQAQAGVSALTEAGIAVAAFVPVAHAIYTWWANKKVNVVAKANAVVAADSAK